MGHACKLFASSIDKLGEVVILQLYLSNEAINRAPMPAIQLSKAYPDIDSYETMT